MFNKIASIRGRNEKGTLIGSHARTTSQLQRNVLYYWRHNVVHSDYVLVLMTQSIEAWRCGVVWCGARYMSFKIQYSFS